MGSSESPFEEGTEGVCGRRKGSDPVQGEVRIQLKKKKKKSGVGLQKVKRGKEINENTKKGK